MFISGVPTYTSISTTPFTNPELFLYVNVQGMIYSIASWFILIPSRYCDNLPRIPNAGCCPGLLIPADDLRQRFREERVLRRCMRDSLALESNDRWRVFSRGHYNLLEANPTSIPILWYHTLYSIRDDRIINLIFWSHVCAYQKAKTPPQWNAESTWSSSSVLVPT